MLSVPFLVLDDDASRRQEIDRTLQRLEELRAQQEQNTKACHDRSVYTRQLSRPFRSLRMRPDSLKSGAASRTCFRRSWPSIRGRVLGRSSRGHSYTQPTFPCVSLSVVNPAGMTSSQQSHRRKHAYLKKSMRAKRVEQPSKPCVFP